MIKAKFLYFWYPPPLRLEHCALLPGGLQLDNGGNRNLYMIQSTWNLEKVYNLEKNISDIWNPSLLHRIRPRFFDQVGHETMCTFSRNKHFFTKSCYHQTYQNYKQPPRTCPNSYFQSYFSVSKIGQIFPKKNFYKEYSTRRPIFFWKSFFENFDF